MSVAPIQQRIQSQSIRDFASCPIEAPVHFRPCNSRSFTSAPILPTPLDPLTTRIHMANSWADVSKRKSREWRSGMRIISLGIFCVLISVGVPHLSGKAFACSVALQYGGKLESGVTSLSNVDRVELANLLITVRDSAAREGAVVIYGFANENERNALVVARRRAEAVQEYLLSLGVWRHRINVDTKIWRNASLVPVSQRNQIEVEFIPACSPGGCENPCG